MTFSVPMGRFLGVPLRLSFLMPVVVIALMWRVQDFVFGLTAGAIILLSLLLHQFATILNARRRGHHPGIVVVWPLGGMNSAASPDDFQDAAAVFLAGPFVNAVLATCLGYELHRSGELISLLNPFGQVEFLSDGSFAQNCLRVAFLANYLLALFNFLIPVRPLACGQVLATFLNLRFVQMETHDLMLRIGLVLSLFGVFAGFVFDVSGLVALSCFLLVLHIQDAMRWYQRPELDEEDRFMGYDFSEGYTSLNRTDDHDEDSDLAVESSGILERWRARRDEEKLRREAEERLQDEEQLDMILEKLHVHGRDALSPRELSLLNRVSARLREKNVQDS
ncbi:MAG: hypothetical protein ACK58L_07330 [Planctomycetota bacterium]